jgi:hypothetical protein
MFSWIRNLFASKPEPEAPSRYRADRLKEQIEAAKRIRAVTPPKDYSTSSPRRYSSTPRRQDDDGSLVTGILVGSALMSDSGSTSSHDSCSSGSSYDSGSYDSGGSSDSGSCSSD